MFYSFSDGGCNNNGKKNAIASYCAMLIDGNTRKVLKGLVQPYKYNINFDQSIEWYNAWAEKNGFDLVNNIDAYAKIESSLDRLLYNLS